MLPIFGILWFFGCGTDENTSTEEVVNSDFNSEPTVSSTDDDVETTDTNRSIESILTFFNELIVNEQIIVGQHCGDGADATAYYYDTYVDALADVSGRHVGLIGADMGFFPSDDYPVQTLIDHWNEGGLVTVSWHTDNPFVDGYSVHINSVENKNSLNLEVLLSDAVDSEARTNYRNELDDIAGALQKLQDAGVIVIWRPFHEMNGDFFWWGVNDYNNQQTNEDAYKALWIDLYNTLTIDYGLDNLIWTYSVIPDRGWNGDVTSFYPGSDYVDLVGMDYYGVMPSFPDFDALKSLGKTIVMSESGPIDSGYGNWNMMEHANALKGKAAYFLQWHSWEGAKVAIIDNKNTIEMMNSDVVITRDEVFAISF